MPSRSRAPVRCSRSSESSMGQPASDLVEDLVFRPLRMLAPEHRGAAANRGRPVGDGRLHLIAVPAPAPRRPARIPGSAAAERSLR